MTHDDGGGTPEKMYSRSRLAQADAGRTMERLYSRTRMAQDGARRRLCGRESVVSDKEGIDM